VGIPGAAAPGVNVVTVSGGSWGTREVVGAGALDALGGLVVCGADVTGRGAGPTVAFVEALSPLLMMTAVATAPTATTAPMNAATGRQRGSFGQASSP
jgi:hypothetical protein